MNWEDFTDLRPIRVKRTQVYRATHAALGDVVLKRHRDPGIANEIACTMELAGVPGVVPLLAHGADWYAMPFVEGETFAALRRRYPMGVPGDVITPLIERVAAILSATHARGFAHGDLNGANVIVSSDGSTTMIDWGGHRVRDAQSGNAQSDWWHLRKLDGAMRKPLVRTATTRTGCGVAP